MSTHRIIALALLALAAAGCSPRAAQVASDYAIPFPSQATATVPEPDSAANPFSPDLYRLGPGEMILAADDDAIPAIFAEDELYLDAERGSREWADQELVIGVEINGDARAFPVRLMSSHEIVNDTIGGAPVAVTWCPLCFSAIVFDRRLDRELTFGVSGYLFKNNLVMYDHQTNTYWSQLLAQGIRGPLRGTELDLLPSRMITWGEWKALHPDTRVLSAELVGYQDGQIVDPYAGYYVSGSPGLLGASLDDRLPAKSLVIGLVMEEQARAYPLDSIQQAGVINDTFAGIPVVLVAHPDSSSVSLYRRDPAGSTLDFQTGEDNRTLVDSETGTSWNPRTGVALEGELEGTRLTRLGAPLVFWFAWADLYPGTQIYGEIP